MLAEKKSVRRKFIANQFFSDNNRRLKKNVNNLNKLTTLVGHSSQKLMFHFF